MNPRCIWTLFAHAGPSQAPVSHTLTLRPQRYDGNQTAAIKDVLPPFCLSSHQHSRSHAQKSQ